MLLEAHVPKQVYAIPLVRAVIIAKWRSFAQPRLQWQAGFFGVYLLVFVLYQVSGPRCEWAGQSWLAGMFLPLLTCASWMGCCLVLLQVLAVQTSDPDWSTQQLLSEGKGQAAGAAGALLLLYTVVRAWQYIWDHVKGKGNTEASSPFSGWWVFTRDRCTQQQMAGKRPVCMCWQTSCSNHNRQAAA
jgi:hypothetical protein